MRKVLMAMIDLGPVRGTPGKDATAAGMQEWLGRYAYAAEGVRAVARENIDTVSGGLLSVDGAQLAAGDAVLLTGQDDARENGLYAAQAGPWNRVPGYAADDGQAFDFKYFIVQSGDAGAGKIYAVVTEGYAIGETELEFTETAFSLNALPGKIVIRNRDGGLDDVERLEGLLGIATEETPGLVKSGGGVDVNPETGKMSVAAGRFIELGGSTANPAVSAAAVRNIYAGTGDMEAGTTALASGAIYLRYEA
jgi:hypothetical protein